MNEQFPFPKPSMWCDNYCERCPRAWDCDSVANEHLRDLQASPKPVIDLRNDIMRAELSDVARASPGARSDHINAKQGSRLRHLANALYVALDSAVYELLSRGASVLADESHACAVAFASSCWQIAASAERELTPQRFRQLEPQLLLARELFTRLRRLTKRMYTQLETKQWQLIRNMQELLRDVLQPMIAHVTLRVWDHVAALVFEGAAPSPFCEVWPDWYHRLDEGLHAAVDGDHFAV